MDCFGAFFNDNRQVGSDDLTQPNAFYVIQSSLKPMFLLGREISPYTHYDIVAGLFDTAGLAEKQRSLH